MAAYATPLVSVTQQIYKIFFEYVVSVNIITYKLAVFLESISAESSHSFDNKESLRKLEWSCTHSIILMKILFSLTF